MSSLASIQALSPSEAVVNRIANLEGADPLELAPLYETVDPDALDALAEAGEGNEAALQIDFTYHGHEVTVTGEGVVHVDGAENAVQSFV